MRACRSMRRAGRVNLRKSADLDGCFVSVKTNTKGPVGDDEPGQAWFRGLGSVICQACAAFAVAFSVGAPAHAERINLIVDRTHYGVEVFLNMPADMSRSHFGLAPSALTDGAGHVAFERLRLGTADVGDEMFSGVHATVGGEPVTLETMSLMVHEAVDPLPFNEPFDGLVAIELCTTPPPSNPLTPQQVSLFAGFVGYSDTPYGPFEMTLPSVSGAGAVEVSVRSFSDGILQEEWRTVVSAGDTIYVAGPRNRPGLEFWALVVAAVAAAGLGAILLMWQSAPSAGALPRVPRVRSVGVSFRK